MRMLPATWMVSMLLACGDSGGSSSTGSGGGSGGQAGSTTSNVGGGTTSGDTGGAGGTGGAGPACPDISATAVALQVCTTAGTLAQSDADSVECGNSVVVYELPVAVGDCVYLRADNVGSPDGFGLSAGIIDPNGNNIEFTNDFSCTVGPAILGCPQGGATIESSGDAYLWVGLAQTEQCTGSRPYQLAISINGSDVILPALCVADPSDFF